MIKGTYTALITPFLEDGSIDERGFQKLIEIQIQNSIQGVVLFGTTGESPTLTQAEKTRLLNLARKIIPSHFQLIVGTGSNSTADTIAETQWAERLGADAAMVVVPYYNKPTQEGLLQHYSAVAASTSLPLIIYNIQGRCGVNLATSTLQKLLQVNNITAVKEASGNISQIMEVIEMARNTRSDFTILSGDDNLTLPVIALGGHGVISVVSNLIPEEVHALVDACLANDWNTARELHYALLPLFRGAFIETNPIPIKTLMHYDELPSGPLRLPLSPLEHENERKLRHLYETLKLPLLTHG
ncbi:MAG: 4-hydroxy-tetrahydrodipicolinate synthase [Parachlamydiaceae bacterium]